MNTQNKKQKIRLTSLFALLAVAALLLTACSAGSTSGVQNGDFSKLGSDLMPTGWSFSSYTGNTANSNCVVITDPERGNVVRLSNASEDDAHFVQEVKVKPNTTYRFTVYAKTENVVGGAGANIGLEELYCYSTPLLGTNDWTLLELVGTTGANQNTLNIGCRLGNFGAVSSGTAYFSDFRMEPINASNYAGTVNNFDVPKSDTNTSDETVTVDEKEVKARTTTAVFTICVYTLVPLAIGFMIWYERVREKRQGGIRIKSPAQEAPSFFKTDASLPAKTDPKLHYTALDWTLVIALTVVYGFIAIFRLGSLKAPESEWKANIGTTATIVFDGTVSIKEIWQDGGITGGSGSAGTTEYSLTAPDGTSAKIDQRFGTMYRWSKFNMPSGGITTDRLELKVIKGEAWINELAFIDANGNPIPAHVENEKDAALLDEQDCVPDYPSYMSGMYFDELYHARTGYENLNGMKIYEISHPPLGKLFISLGIAIFGMNPFGWRIMGAIAGILMVPIMYAFGKRMFKRTGLAFLTACLMAFDFMHFSQTRIATIDSYAVLFNLLMTYYMYKFIKTDLGDSFKSTLLPLFLSGLFFGIGCASKWICLYTGVALAVLFFAKMIVQWINASKIKKEHSIDEDDPAVKNAYNYKSRFFKTCFLCIPFFIILPALIYFASYCTYYTNEWRPNAESSKIAQMRAVGELGPTDPAPENVLTIGEKAKAYVEGVLKNQKYMYSYHSRLTSRHAYESAWYEWPLSNIPMWFYAGYNHPDKTLYGTISSFGNPAVWVVCFAGTIFLVFLTLRGRFKLNAEIFFIFICMASSMVPWMLITRSVYIYHYFATVPMIILASVYVLKHYEDRYYYCPLEQGVPVSKGGKFLPKLKYIWIAAVIIFFIVYYPVISGMPVKKTYVDALELLPTWRFRGVWPDIWHS